VSSAESKQTLVLGATLTCAVLGMGTESVGAGLGILAALTAIWAWGSR
jgi:hypothetical protein